MAGCADANTLNLNAFESQGINEGPVHQYRYSDEDLAGIAKGLYEYAGAKHPRKETPVLQETGNQLYQLVIALNQAKGLTDATEDQLIKITAIAQVLDDMIDGLRHDLRVQAIAIAKQARQRD